MGSKVSSISMWRLSKLRAQSLPWITEGDQDVSYVISGSQIAKYKARITWTASTFGLKQLTWSKSFTPSGIESRASVELSKQCERMSEVLICMHDLQVGAA